MTPNETPIVTLEPGAGSAIRSFIGENNAGRPLRVDLDFSGCCDPGLGLGLDEVREGDLVVETEGLTFVVSSETRELAGRISVAYVDEAGKKGFVLKSSRPVSEWAGFGVCQIKM